MNPYETEPYPIKLPILYSNRIEIISPQFPDFPPVKKPSFVFRFDIQVIRTRLRIKSRIKRALAFINRHPNLSFEHKIQTNIVLRQLKPESLFEIWNGQKELDAINKLITDHNLPITLMFLRFKHIPKTNDNIETVYDLYNNYIQRYGTW